MTAGFRFFGGTLHSETNTKQHGQATEHIPPDRPGRDSGTSSAAPPDFFLILFYFAGGHAAALRPLGHFPIGGTLKPTPANAGGNLVGEMSLMGAKTSEGEGSLYF